MTGWGGSDLDGFDLAGDLEPRSSHGWYPGARRGSIRILAVVARRREALPLRRLPSGMLPVASGSGWAGGD